MTRLEIATNILHSIWLENSGNIAEDKPSEIRWPYTEIIYNIVSILSAIDQIHEGGHPAQAYMLEKIFYIKKYADGLEENIKQGKKDDDP
jgi:hypothetical protein